jgi:hypothetical protein
VTLSRDGQYTIVGCENGGVQVFRTHDISHLYAFPMCDTGIKSLALSHDQRFVKTIELLIVVIPVLNYCTVVPCVTISYWYNLCCAFASSNVFLRLHLIETL